MLLAVDVGNTQTTVGVYAESRLVAMWRLASDRMCTADEIRAKIAPLFQAAGLAASRVTSAGLSCVVPQLTDEWVRAVADGTGARAVVCSARAAGALFRTNYANPEEIGADRVADAVAMLALYGAPSVVVDFGTATNIEVIDREGRFVGGIIAPGLQTSAQTLFVRGAQLPAVGLEAPAQVIGRSTVEAMQAGIVLGEADRVDGLLRRVFDQLGYKAPVVATGGLASLIASHSHKISEVNPELTLEGLRLIVEAARER